MNGRRVLVLVAFGGFFGALSRHAISLVFPAAFPWGTLAVNVLGCFFLGLVVYETQTHGRIPAAARLFVSTGFISSFTTYSTFAGDTLALAPKLAALNIAANYGLGFLAVLCAREVVGWRS